jgi:hypothetical protein
MQFTQWAVCDPSILALFAQGDIATASEALLKK